MYSRGMAKKSVTSAASTDFYIKPLPGYVLCKPLVESQIGGVSISDNMSDRDSGGVVIVVGEGTRVWHGDKSEWVESPVKVGDKIIYSNYGTQRYLDFNTGKHVFFIKFEQIMGVIRE